jgi:hypothetical protein
VSARYLLQTNDDPPAFITVNQSGWRTGEKAILEKLEDPMQADTINPNTYKFRLNVELETGDERYAFLNSCMWVGSGCRRGAEGMIPVELLYSLLTVSSHIRCIPRHVRASFNILLISA